MAPAGAAAAAAASRRTAEPTADTLSVEEQREIDRDKFNRLPHQFAVKEWYETLKVQLLVAVLILINFIVSALEAQILPEDNDDQRGIDIFKGFEWFFAMVFLLELFVNMYGSFFWEFWTGAAQGWNIFDVVVVAVSLISLIIPGMPGVSVLRLLRAFRVFRLFRRVESLRLIIEGVLAALPAVFNAFVVLGIFMGIWSIMGVDFFGEEMDEEFGTFSKALLTMFQVLTMDGWASGLMVDAVDSVGWVTGSLYFISYIFITSIVIANVIIACLLEKYLAKVDEIKASKEQANRKKEKEKNAGTSKEEVRNKEVVWKTPLYRQADVKRWYDGTPVQVFIALLILSNFIMSATYATILPEEDSSTNNVFRWLELAFAILFGIELITNMYGAGLYGGSTWFYAGPMRYWNIFDFIVVLVSFLAWFLSDMPGISVLRLFRAFRVFRLFKRVPSLRNIIEAILFCIPGVLQAFAILLILMGIWSILGVDQMREMAPQFFGNFAQAMLTMWQVLTLDSWASGIARRLIFEESPPVFFVIYFVTFIFVACIIMTNVVITILLEGYLNVTEKWKQDGMLEEEVEENRLQGLLEQDTDIVAAALTHVDAHTLDDPSLAQVAMILLRSASLEKHETDDIKLRLTAIHHPIPSPSTTSNLDQTTIQPTQTTATSMLEMQALELPSTDMGGHVSGGSPAPPAKYAHLWRESSGAESSNDALNRHKSSSPLPRDASGMSSDSSPLINKEAISLLMDPSHTEEKAEMQEMPVEPVIPSAPGGTQKSAP